MRRQTVMLACIFSIAALNMGAVNAHSQNGAMTLELSECIEYALEQNLGLKQYNLGLRYADLSIVQAESAFDPSLSMQLNRNEEVTPNFTDYIPVSSVEREYTSYNITFGQNLTTGANWGVGLYSNFSESNIEREKNFTSNLGFEISQPLLRGFGQDINKSSIYTARISSEQSVYTLQQQAINLINEVVRAYWNLVFARQTLDVHAISIEQADSLLAYNQKGLELGVLTESDVLEARSALASRRQESLDQQNMIRYYEDELRRLLNITSDDAWDTIIEPLDTPEIKTIDLDPQRALEMAFERRPGYLNLIKDIERSEIISGVAKNTLLPNLDMSAGYRLNGSGTSFGEDYEDLGNTDAYGWSVGLQFRYPIGNRSAKSDYEKSQIDVKRALLRVEEMESQIRSEIRSSIRDVELSREQIEAALLTVELNEMKLRMEEERFRNQLSSSYYVLQYQRDLVNSRNQYNRALIDYMLAVIDYQRARGTLLSDLDISILTQEN